MDQFFDMLYFPHNRLKLSGPLPLKSRGLTPKKKKKNTKFDHKIQHVKKHMQYLLHIFNLELQITTGVSILQRIPPSVILRDMSIGKLYGSHVTALVIYIAYNSIIVPVNMNN